MKRKRWELRLVVIGAILGILGAALYDIFKMWFTSLLVEWRPLEYEDAARTVVAAIAGLSTLVLLTLICFKMGLLKVEEKE